MIYRRLGAVSPPSTTLPAPPSAPASASGAILQPKPGTPLRAQRIRELSDLFDKVWNDASGKPGPMPPVAKELALAHADAEHTSFGQGWDGDMKGSRNVASFQGKEPTSYYRIVEHKDSRPMPDGSQKEITTTFRYYIDGTTPDGKSRSAAEAGAWDFLHSITVKPFPAVEQLVAGDVLDYAKRQHDLGYYEGFNLSPEGIAAWKDSIDRLVASGVKLRRQGETPEQVAGRIALYASSMGRSLPEIAAALGEQTVQGRVPADLMTFKPSFVSTAMAVA